MRVTVTTAILALAALAGLVRAEPGLLVTNDGREFEGDVTWTRGKPLRVFDPTAKKWYSANAGDVLRIRCIVTNEEDEKAWVWVEDGRQEKIFTGETYPVRDVVTEITVRSGAVYRGDCRAVIYVRDDAGKKKRFFLKSRYKGETGKTQRDLFHVAEVRFEGAVDGPSERPSLLLKLRGTEVLQVHAVERSSDLHFEARKTADGWLLAGLVPGVYDVAVVAKDGVRLWMQASRDERKALGPEDESAVSRRVSEVEDFFPKHETLVVFGTPKKTRALVLKERTGATSMSKEGERLFRRLEIWTMHRHRDKTARGSGTPEKAVRWYVDGRVMLYREHGDPFQLQTPRPVEEDRRLGGLEAKSGRRTIEIDLAASPPGDRDEDEEGR